MDQTQAGGLLDSPELTPLEQEVLDEYERLADNMNKVRLPHCAGIRKTQTDIIPSSPVSSNILLRTLVQKFLTAFVSSSARRVWPLLFSKPVFTA
jgi:hypothetical protein